MARESQAPAVDGSDKLDGPTSQPLKIPKFRALLVRLTPKIFLTRKQAAAATAVAEAEAYRRLDIPATGPEAAEHKAGAEYAQQFVRVQSARVRGAPTTRIRRRILRELAVGLRTGTTFDRQWFALAAEVPECLSPKILREWNGKKDAELRATTWREQGMGSWTFQEGERRARTRSGGDSLVSYGPRGEVVVTDYDPPALGWKVRRVGVLCQVFGVLRHWVFGVRYRSWSHKKT